MTIIEYEHESYLQDVQRSPFIQLGKRIRFTGRAYLSFGHGQIPRTSQALTAYNRSTGADRILDRYYWDFTMLKVFLTTCVEKFLQFL